MTGIDIEQFRNSDGYFYTIYKTVNNINECFYIGMHKTDNINDRYFGSGVAISRAIKLYGKVNFSKQILKFCLDENDMLSSEKEFITDEMIRSDKCYNLMEGGKRHLELSNEHKDKISKSTQGKNSVYRWMTNGSEHLRVRKDDEATIRKLIEDGWRSGMNDETRNKISDKAKNVPKSPSHREQAIRNLKPGWNKGITGHTLSLEHKEKISKALKGRTFSEEHRINLSKAEQNKIRIYTEEQKIKFSENSKNRIWVNDGTRNMHPKIGDPIIEELLNTGWVFGKLLYRK